MEAADFELGKEIGSGSVGQVFPPPLRRFPVKNCFNRAEPETVLYQGVLRWYHDSGFTIDL